MATVKLEIPDDQAEALAQMCKRIGHAEMEAVSANAAEIKALERGLWVLQKALASVGFEPR
jgi:hypothetical protein